MCVWLCVRQTMMQCRVYQTNSFILVESFICFCLFLFSLYSIRAWTSTTTTTTSKKNGNHIIIEGRETKKRMTLARLLKGLKTVNRRDRTNNQNTQTQARVSKCHHIFSFSYFRFCAPLFPFCLFWFNIQRIIC